MRRSLVATLIAGLLLAACGDAAVPSEQTPVQLLRPGTDRVAEGKRIAAVLGCTGCHGSGLQGENWSEPGFAKLWTSNLTRAAAAYPGDRLEAVVRSGRRPDGSELWGMPSHLFTQLSPDDMAAVLAYIRDQPVSGTTHPRPVFEAKARAEIAAGIWKSAPTEVRELGDTWPADRGERHQRGRYIARATCAECHGMDLKGSTPYPGAKPRPDLAIAAAYSRADFRTLMRTGKAMGDRELELMSDVARGRYAQLTDAEIDALHAYLEALSAATP